MRKQIELLEHHADLAAHLMDVAQIARQFDSVNEDPAALMRLEPVDAADQRRFAGSRRPADDDALAAFDLEVDIAQSVEVAEPLIYADHRDGGILRRRVDGGSVLLGHR